MPFLRLEEEGSLVLLRSLGVRKEGSPSPQDNYYGGPKVRQKSGNRVRKKENTGSEGQYAL